jgi:hypothetical protein
MSRWEDQSRQRAADPASMKQHSAGCRGLRGGRGIPGEQIATRREDARPDLRGWEHGDDLASALTSSAE